MSNKDEHLTKRLSELSNIALMELHEFTKRPFPLRDQKIASLFAINADGTLATDSNKDLILRPDLENFLLALGTFDND